MLSNPLQRFSSCQNIASSTNMSHARMSQTPIRHTRNMETLSQGSQYGMHQLHQPIRVTNHQLAKPVTYKTQRQPPYSTNGRASGSFGLVRRRISRACDQCNQLRTKCDGQHPCAHCVGKKDTATFPREICSKRGQLTWIGRGWLGLRVCP